MIRLHTVEDAEPLEEGRGQRAGSAECLSDQEAVSSNDADKLVQY